MSADVCLEVAHYVALPSQGNIYSLACVPLANGATRIMVSSLKRKVLSLVYERQTDASLCPVVEAVSLPQLPLGCDIVSIDAVPADRHSLLVALAVTKNDERGASAVFGDNCDATADTAAAAAAAASFLLIYSEGCQTQPMFDQCAALDQPPVLPPGGRISIPLAYTPYQLVHASVTISGRYETAFLLSGGDSAVHIYCEDESRRSFAERPLEGVFPDLLDLPSIAIWLDFHWQSRQRRVSAVACECGYVRVSSVCTTADLVSVQASWTVQLDCVVASVRLFTCLPSDWHHQPPPPPLSSLTPPPADVGPHRPQASSSDQQLCNLLAVCTDGASSMFFDVPPLPPAAADNRRSPLCRPLTQLPPPAKSTPADVTDAVTCCCVCDVTMDGRNELLLGTYGQELLVFCEASRDSDAVEQCACEWRLLRRLGFGRPLLAIASVDVIGDGVDELVVLTTGGLYVLQHDPERTANLLCRRLEALMKLTEDARAASLAAD